MKQKLLIPITSLFVAGLMFVPSVGTAQSTTTTSQINSISALLQQMQALQVQIDALRASQKTLQVQVATEFNTFVTSLSLGSRGDAVTALQALLAANPDVYPEGLITGYFGKATEKALKRLQKENGLEQVGRVGPKTRALLNRLLGDNPIAFEDDDDPLAGRHHPILQLDQLALQAEQLAEVQATQITGLGGHADGAFQQAVIDFHFQFFVVAVDGVILQAPQHVGIEDGFGGGAHAKDQKSAAGQGDCAPCHKRVSIQ